MPGLVLWLRYSGFVVLYPTGAQHGCHARRAAPSLGTNHSRAHFRVCMPVMRPLMRAATRRG